MWYSCLSKHLPEQVEINGTRYDIRYGFRTMIAIEIVMYGDMSDEDKIEQALSLFYRNKIPDNGERAIEKLLWFHRCGMTGEDADLQEGTGHKKQQCRAYDFVQDAGMIYAAFKQQYGVNLHTIKSDEMHWWEFSSLFDGLTDMTKMGKVIYWRTCDTRNMSKIERKYIQEMRKIFAIKDTSTMDVKTNASRLASRNDDMIRYVERRYEECQIR